MFFTYMYIDVTISKKNSDVKISDFVKRGEIR